MAVACKHQRSASQVAPQQYSEAAIDSFNFPYNVLAYLALAV